DLEQARQYLRRVGRVFAYVDNRYRPRLRGMQGRLHHYSGHYQQALTAYQQAREQYRAQREFAHVARMHRILTEVYMYLGRYREALDAGRQAIRYFTRHEMLSDAAQTMTNVGNVYHRMDNNRMALRYYDRARDIFAESGGIPLAIVDYNRANILTNLFRLSEARELYEQAAQVYAGAGMAIPETLCRYSIAYLLFLDGLYVEAMTLFEKVLDRFEEVGEQRAAAVTRLDLAELNLQLNQFGSTVMLSEDISPVFRRLGMRYEEGKAHFFRALGELSLGQTGEASRSLRQAEKRFGDEGNELWLGMVSFARCRLLMARGKYDEAARESTRARRLFVKSKDERRAVDADISHLAARLKSSATKRIPSQARALQAKRLTRHQTYRLHDVLGEHHFGRRDYKTALRHLRPAVKQVEKMVSRLQQHDIRHFFVADKVGTYRRLIRCLLELGRSDEAFVQNLDVLALINQPAVSDQVLRDRVPSALLEQIEELRQSFARYQQFPRSGQRSGATLAGLRTAEQRLWSLEQKARAEVAGGMARDRVAQKIDVGLLGSLEHGDVLVNFVGLEDTVGAFVASREKVSFHRLPLSEGALRASVRKLHFLFESIVHAQGRVREQSIAAADYLLAELYEQLMKPLESRLRGDRLLLLLDGLFAQIPFVALGVGETRLVDRYELRFLVDPASLAGQEPAPTDWSSRRSAVFSVPSPTLPSVEREAEDIAGIFGDVTVYPGEVATTACLRSELARADGFVHIATHASRSSENPLFSRMLMADGPFFPFDLFGTGVRAGLTALSGCQTAAPGLNYGNSFSLAKAFYQAGSRYVLASLWPVNDSLTRTFMAAFYGQLRQGETVSKAYTAAVGKLRQLDAPTAFWGSFVLLGV
ncbi:CHAT domain-containing protein, partial [candidate division GN15 bacterium]|nr:CHAT domain-containing protein [candidate division GN15 bacterium]